MYKYILYKKKKKRENVQNKIFGFDNIFIHNTNRNDIIDSRYLLHYSETEKKIRKWPLQTGS